MPRVVWKGAISFGLVHVPVVLHAGARRANLDFDWIDKRDMAPVGYSRINKRTGKAIDFENIVKGYQYEKGEYVLMSDEDFKQANPKATQTVEIICFVDVAELAPYYFDTPYYLAPDKRGDKGYALLRETLRESGRAGIANVVLHTKQHLAAVMVVNDVLLLNTMRYADEIQSYDELNLPTRDLDDLGISAREIDMALRLVDDMTEEWDASQFRDTYRDDLLARIEAKIEGGQTRSLAEVDDEKRAPRSSNVIDLMAMLKQSIESRAGGKGSGKSRASAPVAADDDRDDEADNENANSNDNGKRGTAKSASRSSASKASSKKSTSKTVSKAANKTASKKATSASKRAAKAAKTASASAKKSSKSAAKSAGTSTRKTTGGQRRAA